jgi:hypothetical protein
LKNPKSTILGKKANKKILATGMEVQTPNINYSTSKKNVDSLTSSQQPIKMIKDPSYQSVFGNRITRSKSHFRLNLNGREDFQMNNSKSKIIFINNNRIWKHLNYDAKLYDKALQNISIRIWN